MARYVIISGKEGRFKIRRFGENGFCFRFVNEWGDVREWYLEPLPATLRWKFEGAAKVIVGGGNCLLSLGNGKEVQVVFSIDSRREGLLTHMYWTMYKSRDPFKFSIDLDKKQLARIIAYLRSDSS